MASKSRAEAGKVLEHGDIFFFYHPKAKRVDVRGLEDVSSFHMLMHPLDANRYRYAAIGLKSILGPKPESAPQWWARMENVERDANRIRHRLEAVPPLPAARPCGEGVYAVGCHGRHTHLAYALELPEEPGEVQKALGIAQRANPFLGVVNPVFEALEGVESPQVRMPGYPPHLVRLFGDRHFNPADPVELLDYEGTEILVAMLEGASGADTGLDLVPEHEDEHTAEIFRLLKIRRDESPMDPLFAGKWA